MIKTPTGTFEQYEVGDTSPKAVAFANYFDLPEFNVEAYDLYQKFLWDRSGWETAQLVVGSNWEFIRGRVA